MVMIYAVIDTNVLVSALLSRFNNTSTVRLLQLLILIRARYRSYFTCLFYCSAVGIPAWREDQRRDSGIRGAGMIYVNRSHEKA